MGLIREEEVSFGPGLNILTGETGAGKSMIIGSVNVALGTGSFKDYSSIEDQPSFVELVFDDCPEAALSLLREKDLSAEDGQIIIARRQQGARTISRVNGETVPLRFVKDLAGTLLDLHGQHEHQSLLYPAQHLRLLDRYALPELGKVPEDLKRAYDHHLKIRKELENALTDERDRAKQMDLLAYEIQEIEDAQLVPGEDEELEAEYRKMSNGQKILSALEEVSSLTSGADGASDAVSRSLRALMGISDYDRSLGDMYAQLLSVEELMNDFAREVDSYLDDFGYDEQRFYEMGKRLDLINHLKTKYGKTIEEILAYAGQQQARLDRLNDYDAYLDQLKQEERETSGVMLKLAETVSAVRKKKAAELEGKITAALSDLNFLHAAFSVAFEREEICTANGFDKICFMISTNPGMPMRPLQTTASGGELSRIMLAIKSVMADRDEIDSLIFDEIDTGISGRTAQRVAEKMAAIAGKHQVICITHLAQIAAMADRHFEICKETVSEGTSTQTHIRLLSEEETINELSRILGGTKITDAVVETAAEMKKLAKDFKEKCTDMYN